MKGINMLADEVLQLIFKFVPSRPRRENVRLVCRRWNRICDDSIFTKEDTTIFNPQYDFDSVIPCFAQSRRKLYNLRFVRQQICWTEDEICFWQCRGHQIQTICLQDTLLNLVDLKIMLSFCPNLKELSIRCGGTKFVKKLLEKFEDFASLNFAALSVTNFKLSLEDHCENLFTSYSLSKIFSTFPNVIGLDIKLPFSCTISEKTSNLAAECLSVSDVIDIVQSMGKNLKSLFLSLKYICNCRTSKFVDISKLLPQLEKIEDLKFAAFSFIDHSLFQSCIPSVRLTKVTSLNVPLTSIKGPAKDFIILLLNTFTNLHTLQLDEISRLEIDQILLQKLLTSRLKELHLYIRQFSLEANAGISENLSANRNLERLTLRSTGTRGEEYESLISTFVQNFKNIRDLSIHFPNDAIMRHIFSHQKHLKNLRLENCYECLKLGLPDIYDAQIVEQEDTYSICDLKDLELLQISVCDTESLISEKNFPSLMLPKLKHFELKYLDQFKISSSEVPACEPTLLATGFEELIKAIKNSPDLEYLKLHFQRAMTQTELEQLLTQLKHLRYIFIKDSCYHISRCRCKKQVKYDYEKLFKISPSLHAIVHNYIRFYPDVIKKRIEAYPKDFEEFMTTGRAFV